MSSAHLCIWMLNRVNDLLSFRLIFPRRRLFVKFPSFHLSKSPLDKSQIPALTKLKVNRISIMDEEAAKPKDSTANQQHQYYYGTFQGVANYPPPAPPPQLLPLLQQPQHPIAANPIFPGRAYQNVEGVPVPDYTVVEVRPIREHDIPCCGLGMGWFLFMMGFLFGGIPWYLGAFIILCTSVDHREKAGYVACAIASVIYLIAFMLGMTGNVNIW